MTIFKCKMCGGALEVNNNETVCECEYCGTLQTLPKMDNEKKINLYDRANHFRRNNDFDKAMSIYEKVLEEDTTDAESYWSLVLCRYGIEYVDDPSTHKRVPTVNRTQYTSIFMDEDYKSAIEHADSIQRKVYEEEAKKIDEIQKGILEISNKEKPFDVFICYKETDNNGRRTPDSVLAQDLYHQLTKENFKVFFSRITLEDKLGSAYEPYIFAALNSAKVMVVVGTKPEYFDAVWVKNEWSRYLNLIKQGQEKVLIPAYRDMNPYNFPEEFSHLQAQDMSKLGFMQDLIRGIKKITHKDEKPKTVERVVNSNVTPLLKRGYMALEDEEFERADDFFEQALNQDAENAEAYLGKLLVEYECSTKEELKNLDEPFDDSNNYRRIQNFGSEELKEEVNGYIDYINNRNETNRLDGIYKQAISKKDRDTVDSLKEAVQLFNSIDYKDSKEQIKQCEERIKEIHYEKGSSLMNGKTISSYKDAIEEFKYIEDYKDSKELIEKCNVGINEIYYNKAINFMKKNTMDDYNKALQELDHIKDYSDAWKQIENCKNGINEIYYQNGLKLFNNKTIQSYKDALVEFEKCKEYKDSNEKIKECNKAIAQLEAAKIAAAKKKKRNIGIGAAIVAVVVAIVVVFVTVIQPNNHAKNQIAEIQSSSLKVGDTITLGTYNDEDIEWIVLDKTEDSALIISKYILDKKKYNEESTNITWENCTLRSWLNDEFLNSSFRSNIQDMIKTTNVVNDDNSKYGTVGGNDTEDKIFLLSIDEMNQYFGSNRSRKATYTDGSSGWYWLRSPGAHHNLAASVVGGGRVYEIGYDVDHEGGIRPAMWISLE